MKKSFSQLKRDLKVGTKLKTLYHYRENMVYNREITKVQSNSIATVPVNNKNSKECYCYLPYASLVEYTDNKFSVYESGCRKFTKEEEVFYNNRPSNKAENKELVELDMYTDSNTTYYMDKYYFETSKYNYLFTNRVYNGNNCLEVKDNKVKGNLICTFEIIKE